MDTLRADGRRSRRAILDAATAAVLEGGDLGFSAVARRAGVTRATVYRHFATSDDLLGAVARELAAGFLEPLLAEMDSLPLEVAWRALAELVVAESRRHTNLAAAVGDVERMARVAVTDEPIEGFLRRRRQRGEIGSAAPDAWLARAVRALCLGAMADAERPADESVDLLAQCLARVTS